ncbi:hypothetical protein [Cyanobium sp. Morenito 9A2]|uniref:hypothetical protein n=1 Tax=Cyanobium sp. Morenito 9A2 TaxID=2823718 RepID=UPI0020CE1C91|nr:hypothetical protein [Cyanobium sp. Morenito 9A2]MCP9850984.1 hypothetical protein [Cyanobium sp. Morenito 9A2]
MTSTAAAASTLLVGLFYAFAGGVAARAVIRDTLLDAALDGLAARRPDPLVRERALWLFTGAAFVGASGLLLAISSLLAVPAFLISCLGQAAHFLVLSPRRYDREDPVDPAGRRRSLHAFRTYGLATAFVLWAGWSGALRAPGNGSPWPLALVAAAWLIASGWGLVQLRRVDRAFRSGGDP